MTAESLLRVRELAELLGVSERWIHDRVQAEALPGFRLYGSKGPLRFRESEILAWLEDRRTGPEPPARRERPGGRSLRAV